MYSAYVFFNSDNSALGKKAKAMRQHLTEEMNSLAKDIRQFLQSSSFFSANLNSRSLTEIHHFILERNKFVARAIKVQKKYWYIDRTFGQAELTRKEDKAFHSCYTTVLYRWEELDDKFEKKFNLLPSDQRDGESFANLTHYGDYGEGECYSSDEETNALYTVETSVDDKLINASLMPFYFMYACFRSFFHSSGVDSNGDHSVDYDYDYD